MTLLLVGKYGTPYETDHILYEVGGSIDFVAVEKLVRQSINNTISIVDFDDEYRRTLWTYNVGYKTVKCNGVNYCSDIQTIAYHSQEIISWVQGMREVGINHRRSEIYA